MRPLPDLSPLPPSQSVYDPSQDDFLSLFGNDLNSMDSLQSSLCDQQNTLGSNLDPIGSSLDQIDGIISDIETVFDTLSSELDLVDLTTNILDAQGLDDALDNNLDSYSPNILVDIGKFLTDILKAVYQYLIVPLFNFIVQLLDDLWNQIIWILGQLGDGQDVTFDPTGWEFTFDFSF